MVPALLIFLYTAVLIFLIDRLTRNRIIRLSRQELALAFSFKICLGIAYGYIFKTYYGGDDTWAFFNRSVNDEYITFRYPARLLKELFPFYVFDKHPDLFSGLKDFLANLEGTLVIFPLHIFNFLSFDNYYVDVVFFNLFSFFGSYLLYKLFVSHWPDKRRLIFIAAFLIPSVSFWLSGIRSDGLLLLSTGILLFYFDKLLVTGKASNLVMVIIGLAGTMIFRLEFAFILLPGLIAWAIISKFNRRPWLAFGLTYLIAALLFFGSSLVRQESNLLTLVTNRQAEFLQLKGTAFKMEPLQPTFQGFALAAPSALANSFLRPFPWEAKGPLQIAASLDVIFFWLIIIWALIRADLKWNVPLVALILFFGVSAYLLIGYTVPYPGAIVRYKVIPELLFYLFFVTGLPLTLKKIKY